MVWLMEDVMGMVVDPAALGGLAGLVALASWAVGRMQGDAFGKRQAPALREFAALRMSPDGVRPLATVVADAAGATAHRATAGTACQHRALEERRALLADPGALAELHAEASAIRRDERVFDHAAYGDALIAVPQAVYERECRYLGRSGQPTCADAARHACDASRGCQADAIRAPAAILPEHG